MYTGNWHKMAEGVRMRLDHWIRRRPRMMRRKAGEENEDNGEDEDEGEEAEENGEDKEDEEKDREGQTYICAYSRFGHPANSTPLQVPQPPFPPSSPLLSTLHFPLRQPSAPC
jgi:hypothetical protein